MMVDKNEDLPMIRGNGRVTPLYMAALFGHREMVLYLYDKTDFGSLGASELVDLFHAIIGADIYGIYFFLFLIVLIYTLLTFFEDICIMQY